MGWYEQGEKGEEKAKEESDRAQERFSGPQRFWLAPDKSTKFVFLDTAGFFFKEHNYNDGRDWLNWVTCLDDIGEEECPFCLAERRYSYVAAFSIIDLSKYKSKKTGELVTARKKLILFKSTARDKMLKQKERHEGDLTRCVFETTRYNKKECSTGEDFEFLKRVQIDEIKEMCPTGEDSQEFVTPFNYAELFAPKSAAELRKILGVAPPVGSEESSGSAVGSAKPPTEGGDARSLKDLL